MNTQFEAHKLRRELKRSGRSFAFARKAMNKYGEQIAKSSDIGAVTGIYHEQNSNILLTTSDAAQVRTKKTPMILCLYDDAVAIKLQPGDSTIINGREFKVVGIVNIQEWGIIGDISLELVDDGARD